MLFNRPDKPPKFFLPVRNLDLYHGSLCTRESAPAGVGVAPTPQEKLPLPGRTVVNVFF